jgi:hypothetical protein
MAVGFRQIETLLTEKPGRFKISLAGGGPGRLPLLEDHRHRHHDQRETHYVVPADYHTAKMPPVNDGLLDGQLAWRQHDGGHTDAPNMKYFLKWADKFIGHSGGLD